MSNGMSTLAERLASAQFDLYAYISVLMGGAAEVADVLQETNLAILTHESNYDPSRPFMFWARGVDAPNCLWLRAEFTVPEGWGNGRLVLDFHRMNAYGIVYVNGKRIGELLHPSWKLEITAAAKPGGNVLQIFGTRDYTGLSIKPETDPLRDGSRGKRGENFPYCNWPEPAVSGPVDLIRLPRPAAVVDAFVKTSVRNWTINVEVDIDAEKAVSGLFGSGATVACDIYDTSFNKVKRLPRKPVDLVKGVQTVTLADTWRDPKLWDIEQPNLYYAIVSLYNAKGEEIDSQSFRFGFREVWAEGRHVMLNGHVQRFRLEGAWIGLTRNTLGFWNGIGRTLMLNQPHPNKWWYFSWWNDCPLREDQMIDICDTEGFAFEESVPTMNRTVNVFADPLFRKNYTAEAEIWMRRYRNNPSLILWTISMNFINPKNGIHPDLIGQVAGIVGVVFMGRSFRREKADTEARPYIMRGWIHR